MKQRMRFEGNEKGTREKKCMKLTQVFITLAVFGSVFLAGCITPEPEKPVGNLSVASLLDDPVYDTEVAIYGQVSLLGELFCPCFELTSGGETVQVWHGLMVKDDGTERPAVSVEGIENGDWVIVTGELKTAGAHRSENDFWARTIEKIEDIEDYGISPSPEFTGITEAESKAIARAFVENSPTYQFDGFDLVYNKTTVLRCPYCWAFTFDFTSRQAGYGNRTGKVLAQVITPHRAEVTVINGTITSAVLDGQWDMLTQSYLSKMAIDEALAIAQNSTCVQEGTLTDTYVYNEFTRTWWIDLEPFSPQEGCNPACVVYEDTRTADINWRCTGALPPVSDKTMETCSTEAGENMTLQEALKIADTSECVEVGMLTTNYFCNPVTGTWWIDLAPFTEREGCNPACVVNITTRTAEVNLRCTGLLIPE